jgi:hypothetical protein
LNAKDIAKSYGARWDIELLFKELIHHTHRDSKLKSYTKIRVGLRGGTSEYWEWEGGEIV